VDKNLDPYENLTEREHCFYFRFLGLREPVQRASQAVPAAVHSGALPVAQAGGSQARHQVGHSHAFTD
jgi:hypothetical protein